MEALQNKTANCAGLDGASDMCPAFGKIRPALLLFPLVLLLLLAVFLYYEGALGTDAYIAVQKDSFYFINRGLRRVAGVEYNLTQLGDTAVLFLLFSFLVVRRPRLWCALIFAAIVSGIFSKIMKFMFAIPRPAASLDPHSFVIVGETLAGHNSLPSGHSITVFTFLTVLLYGYFPRQVARRAAWTLLFVFTGGMVAVSRVSVGAHYPLDVFVGSVVGYISGVLGLLVAQRFRGAAKFMSRKYLPYWLAMLVAVLAAIGIKTYSEPLPIFVPIFAISLFNFYVIIKKYLQKPAYDGAVCPADEHS